MSRSPLFATLGPPALFLLLSAVFLWQPILTGQAFLPTDLAFRYDFAWKALEGTPGLVVAQNPLLSDVSDYYYPYATFAGQQLRAGQFPLWNPYILGGAPFHAATQAAVLDPINLLTYLAGPLAYWTWAAWLRLAVIGWTTYGLLRALGRSPVAGVGSGVVFMCCGFVTVWLNYSVVTSLLWLPGLLWATTRLVQTGRAVWSAATAFAIGGLLLGGHPETQFLVALLWGFYGLCCLAVTPGAGRVWAGGLARLAGAAGGGLALGAVQWVPFVELLARSSALGERATAIPPFNAGESLLRLGVLVFPNLSGTPLEHNYWVPPFTNFNEQAGYFGLLALALAVLGVAWGWRQDRRVLFFAGAAGLALLLAIRAPGFHLVKALPVFNVGHGVRWVIVWSFCGAVLAGYGLDALRTLDARGWRRVVAGGAGLVGIAAGVLLGLYAGVRWGGWDAAWGAVLPHEDLVRLFDPTHRTLGWPVGFLALAVLVAGAWAAGRLGSRAAGAGLVLLLYADLWAFGSRYNPVTPPEAIFPPTAATQRLAADLGHERFAAMTGLLRPNAPMILGLRDLRGYEDVVDATQAQMLAPLAVQLDPARNPALQLTREDDRLLRVAGVRYVLAARKLRGPDAAAPYRNVQEQDGVAIYEHPAALPRAYVVYSTTVVPDAAAARTALLAPAHDPGRTAVLTGGPVLAGPALDYTAAPVTWLQDGTQEVVLRATLPAPGVLVLSDTDAPGWEATVDGQPAPVLRANGIFRAVALPAGAHTVQFIYRPPVFYGAVLVSLAAALGIVAVALRQLWGSQRRRHHG